MNPDAVNPDAVDPDGPELHVAGFDELDARTGYALWQLREAVFVVEQQCPYPELDGRDLDPDTRHLWLAEGTTPVAYLRVLGLAGPGEPRIGRVLTAVDRRGLGFADRLVRAALELVGDRPSRLEAQAHLVDWYARFGYRVAGEEYLEDGIPHLPMRRG